MPELFSPNSPFVALDHRRFRAVLPTTAELLNTRHTHLMPEEIVRGRSILDLGSCMGATGEWALAHGATQYTGVEHQERYAQQAAELLASWPQAQILTDDAALFAAREQRHWNVVSLLGLVHGLYDPLALIRDAAALATDYLCFEDFGLNEPSAAIVCTRHMAMPIAGECANTRGFGWQINPSAMQLVMENLGFEQAMAPFFLIENRWLCRYRRVGAPRPPASYSSEKHAWTQ